MAYTLNANFIKDMGRATVEPVVHCSIALSGTTMDFHSSPEALDSTVTGDPLLGEVTTVSQSVDPISRKVQHGEMTFTLVDDGKIRGLVSSQSFNEKIITVKLGSTALALSDFVGIFKGPIISVIPQEGRIVIKARAFTNQTKGVKTYRTYYGEHPFTVVSQMLQDCGVVSGDIDSASFTPSNHSDISHYNFSSVVMYNTGQSTPPALQGGLGIETFDGEAGDAPNAFASQEISVESFINEVMRLTRSTLVHDPASGDIKIVRYDSSASVTKHFTTDEYTDFEQLAPSQGIITEVKTAFGKIAATDLLMQSDTTAATNLGASDYSHTINYLSGSSMVTHDSLAGGSTSLSSASGEGSMSGTRGGMLGGSQPADAKISASRPFYALWKSEIIKSTGAFTIVTGVPLIHANRDHDGDLTGSTTELPMGFTGTLVSRPFAGTEVDAAGTNTGGAQWGVIVDATPAFDFGDYIINRFSNTAPVISILVGLEHLNIEIGDLVSLDNDLFLSSELGLDGLDSSVKFEVTKREILPLGDSVGIDLELTYATKTSAPSVTVTSKPPVAVTSGFGRVSPPQLIAESASAGNRSILDNRQGNFTVSATSGLGVSVSGGIATAAGMALGSSTAQALTMTASKHTYLGINMFTGGIVKQEVATSANEPGLLAGELRLAKVVTDGSSVTSVEDLRQYGSVSVNQIDRDALAPGKGLIWNGEFTSYPDNDTAPPGWSVTTATPGTDFIKSDTVKSGRNSVKALGTGQVVRIYSDKVPINQNKPYRASAYFRQSSAENMKFAVYWWKADRSASSTAYTFVHNANLSSTGAWIPLTSVLTPPSDARYASLDLYSTGGSGITSYFNNATITEEPMSFSAYISSDQSPSTQDQIDFDTESHDYGGIFDHGNQRMAVTESGVYCFTISLKIEPSSNSKGVTILIRKNATAYNNGTEIKTINLGDIATGDPGHELVTYTEQAIELAEDDRISAFITFSAGQPVIAGTAYDSSWSGRKIS